MPVFPYIGGFPLCCGMRIFNGFPYGPPESGDQRASKEQIDTWLKAELEEYGNKAMLVLSLNADQKKYLHQTMIDNSFKIVASGRNGAYGNMIYLYVWERPEPKKNIVKMAKRRFGG